MDRENLQRLQELKEAIVESLCSRNIVQAIAALERSGHQVQVSIDATFNETTALPGVQTIYSSVEPLLFSPADEQFLRGMHIAI